MGASGVCWPQRVTARPRRPDRTPGQRVPPFDSTPGECGAAWIVVTGDQYTATGEWTIENLPIGDNGYQMTYRLTDIYGNKYWTASISD